MILTTRDESNTKATVWNNSKKFMPVQIHVLKIASVAKIYIGIRRYFAKQQKSVSVSSFINTWYMYIIFLQLRVIIIESLLRSLPENQSFLYYMKGWNISIANCGQITTPYHILRQIYYLGILEQLFLGTPDCCTW